MNGMSKANVKRKYNRDLTFSIFIMQRATDEAKNEKMKSERDENKLDPEQANRGNNRSDSTDSTSQKKTGSGSSKSLGD